KRRTRRRERRPECRRDRIRGGVRLLALALPLARVAACPVRLVLVAMILAALFAALRVGGLAEAEHAERTERQTTQRAQRAAPVGGRAQRPGHVVEHVASHGSSLLSMRLTHPRSVGGRRTAQRCRGTSCRR